MGRTLAYDRMAAQAAANLAQIASQTPMPALRVARNCFNGGEISPELAARFDQQRVAQGCHSLLNMIALPWGGISKRPGMGHVDYALNDSGFCRLIPFVFSASQSRLLEFGEQNGKTTMRCRDSSGRLAHETCLPIPPACAAEMSYCQSCDVIFVAHEDMPPGKICRYSDTDWRYEEIHWLPAIQAPEWASVGAKGSWPEGNNRWITLEYVVTAVDAETGAESAPSPTGRIWGTAPLSESWYAELIPKAVPGASEYRIYKKSAGVFGFIGRITDLEGDLVFEDRNIAPDTEDTPPNNKNPFDGPGNYPSLVFLHQQRLGFAASRNRPLTIWLSQSGNLESMAASVPPDADDAIEATLAAPQANRILWALSDRSGLAFGTEGGEWLLVPGEGAALSPTDLSFEPQTSYGSEPGLPAIKAAGSILFAQRGGRVVRDLGYSFQDDRYNASDLSVLARHLFKQARIVAWTWQQEPCSILWLALGNGTLAALTFLRDQEVMAWHRHETAGQVEDLCAIPDSDGDTALFLAVNRDCAGGKRRSIEKLAPFSNTGSGTRHLDGPEQAEFQARCVPVLPEITTDTGTTYLLVRKISEIKAQVLNSMPFQARVLSQNGQPSALMPVPARGADFTAHAVWNCPLAAGFRENCRLELIFDGPDPATLSGLLISMETADASGGQR